MRSISNVREIVALVPMRRLLTLLGVDVNDGTRRGPCPIHGGKNRSAFAWREEGRWRCFSCGASGDRIALVMAVKQCSFHRAVKFIAAEADVEFRSRRVSRRDLDQIHPKRARVEQATWHVVDEIAQMRRYYTGGLHRAERLQERLGRQLSWASTEAARDQIWKQLARLCVASTFFLAGWRYLWDASPKELTRFALATPYERRRFILEGTEP
jgi:hypothetical protein